MIIVRQTVRVEPLGLQQRLGRQLLFQNFSVKRKCSQSTAVRIGHVELNGRRTRRQERRVQRQPEAAPLGGHGFESLVPFSRTQQIRQKAGAGGEVVVVPCSVTGVVTGDELDAQQAQRACGGAGTLQAERGGAFAEIVVLAGVGQLKRPSLIFQKFRHSGQNSFGPAIRQNFFEAVGQ